MINNQRLVSDRKIDRRDQRRPSGHDQRPERRVQGLLQVYGMLVLAGLAPAGSDAAPAVYELNERAGRRLHYGDVLLSPKQLRLRRYKTAAGPAVRHIAVKERGNNRWSNNEIPYQISNKYFEAEKEKLLNAFRTLEQRSCFRFVPHSDQVDYLFVEKMDGCFSFVGRIGGRQLVSLAGGCLYDYIIWHELMHALGLEHEHQRPDRDRYIRVQYDNVDPEKLLNFELIPSADVDLYHGYDYASIMHYDGRAFGRFDPVTRRPMVTMVPLKSNVELVDNLVLTEMDAEKLRILGGCPTRRASDSADSSRQEEAGDQKQPHRRPKTSSPSAQSAEPEPGENLEQELEKNSVPGSPNGSAEDLSRTPSGPAPAASSKCGNRSAECSRFREKGYCSNYRYKRLMLLYCPASCGYCGGANSNGQ